MKHNAMVTISLPINKTDDFIAVYDHERTDNKNPYVLFSANHDGINILLYQKDHHGFRKAVFSGPNSRMEASLWGIVPQQDTEQSEKVVLGWQDLGPQIGSDEVGTGDFFGPIIVCATYFSPKHLPLLDDYRIGDSKAISDDEIRRIVPHLIKVIPYSLLTVDNEKYNELVASGYNINKIKAWLHQSALAKLHKKHRNRVPIYIDQFCTSAQFNKYISGHPDTKFDIVFKTKAENQYPSVAIASMIARYAFLQFMDRLNKKYDATFPFGASIAVDKVAKTFVNQKGLDKLKPLVKQNFKNFKRLLETID